MSQANQAGFRRWAVPGLLIGAIGGELAWLWSTTTSLTALWGRCLDLLDVRNWPHWAWTGVGIGLLSCLLLMRLWPDKKPSS